MFFFSLFRFCLFLLFHCFLYFCFFHPTRFSPGLSKFFNLCLCCMLACRTHGSKSSSLNKEPSLLTQSTVLEKPKYGLGTGKGNSRVIGPREKIQNNLNQAIFTTNVCFVVLLRFHLVHLCGSVDHVPRQCGVHVDVFGSKQQKVTKLLSWILKCFASLSVQLLQTFSSIAHEIFASVKVSTVPLLLVTSIILQLFFCSPTLSISDTENVKYKGYCC